MSDDISDRIANNLGRTFKRAAMHDAHLVFNGRKYDVRVANEGTDREQLIVFRKKDGVGSIWGWEKPMVIGG